MLDALDAKLRVLGRDGGVGIAGHRDIGGEIDLAELQRIRELEADARRGRIRIDLVVDDAEAVLLAQILIGRADIGVVDTIEAGAVGVERGAPALTIGVDLAEERQRLRLVGRGRGALIGGVGGVDGAFAQDVFLAAVLGLDREGCARIAEPGCGILLVDADRGAEQRQGPALIAARQRRQSLGGELGGRALDEVACLLPQRRLEADHIACEIVLNEGFVGEGRRNENRREPGPEQRPTGRTTGAFDTPLLRHAIWRAP